MIVTEGDVSRQLAAGRRKKWSCLNAVLAEALPRKLSHLFQPGGMGVKSVLF